MANRTKTLAHFAKHLADGETIAADIFGTYEGEIAGKAVLRNGIMVATNQRVVFFTKKLFGYELETFYYSRISSVSGGRNFLGEFVKIHTTGNTATLKWIKDGEAKVFFEFVNNQISNQ